MIKSQTKNLVLAGMLLALGIVLPQFVKMFPPLFGSNAGSVILPMHIPVLLCGLICGWKYGLVCGALTPFLCSIMTGMPPLFPFATGMMFELAAYAVIAGVLYKNLKQNIFVSLVAAMIGGRIVLGIANTIFFNMKGIPYGFEAFITSAFITALPGIIIQLLLIPTIILSLRKSSYAN